MLELRNVRILLVPTGEQRQKFFDSAYYAHKIYNIGIDWNKQHYSETGMFMSKYAMFDYLVGFKAINRDYDSISNYALRTSLSNLRSAFDRMKQFNGGFPRYKSYNKSKKSFGVRSDYKSGVNTHLRLQQNSVKIPSIGLVKCKHCHYLTRSMSNEVLLQTKFHNAHIVFDNKYWFLVFGVEVRIVPEQLTDNIVGIDFGVTNTIYTSDNHSEPNINKTNNRIQLLEHRKRRLQRKISRSYERNKEGTKFIKTKNIKRLEQQVRLIHRTSHNIRINSIHETTIKVLRLRPKRIMLEDLNVKGMLFNRHLSKSVQEQLFYHRRRILTEKAKNYTIEVGIVPRWEPSSKRCSVCGKINKRIKLSDRVFWCIDTNCSNSLDRDYNAAINLKNCSNYKLA